MIPDAQPAKMQVEELNQTHNGSIQMVYAENAVTPWS